MKSRKLGQRSSGKSEQSQILDYFDTQLSYLAVMKMVTEDF